MTTITPLPTLFGQHITLSNVPPIDPMVGTAYMNPTTGDIFYYTGNHWRGLYAASSTTSTTKIETVEELCEKHPGLAELKKELDIATEKFEMYKALVTTEHNNNG